jgi:hypothetical protein
MELGLVLSVLKEGLKLSNTIIDRKYLDRVIDLEKEFYEELARPDDERSDLALDNIMLELRTIAAIFAKYNPKK